MKITGLQLLFGTILLCWYQNQFFQPSAIFCASVVLPLGFPLSPPPKKTYYKLQKNVILFLYYNSLHLFIEKHCLALDVIGESCSGVTTAPPRCACSSTCFFSHLSYPSSFLFSYPYKLSLLTFFFSKRDFCVRALDVNILRL